MPARRAVVPYRRRVYRRRPYYPRLRPMALTGYGDYRRRKAPVVRRKAPARSGFRPSKYASQMSALGHIAGTALAGPMGGLAGHVGGAALAHGIKALTGFGDYTVKKNVFSPGAPPSIVNRNLPGGAVCIRHKEYLGDIISSSNANTFNLQSFSINAALETSFPWLAQLAANFTSYQFEGLLFEYRTMSADALNSVNTALGQVIMATQYDPVLPNFATKAEMENTEYSQSVKPSESCVHLIECAPSANVLSHLYTREGAVPAGQDQRFYDLGNFQIATNGLQGTSVNLGELWVSYQVCLYDPIMWSALGNTQQYAHFNNVTGVSNSVPLGTSNLTPTSGSTLAATINSAGTIITLPPIAYRVTYIMMVSWFGSSTAITYPTITNSNLTNLNIFFGNTSFSTAFPQSGATCTQCSSWKTYVTPGNGTSSSVTFSTGGTLPSSPTAIDIFILQIPNVSN
ncbi:capsid protein [Crucivirus-389]|nr:capsid protein [Crucivirus-389]